MKLVLNFKSKTPELHINEDLIVIAYKS